MADVAFVAIAIGFFAICVLYVRWCDSIMGRDDTASVDTLGESDAAPDAVVDEVAA